MSNSIFTQIINREIPANIIFEDGEYKKLDLNEDQALEFAKKSGNIIPFGKNKDAAIDFSKNYKPEEFKEYYKGLLQG